MHALDIFEETLTKDHKKAAMLADGLREVGYQVVHPDTNIVNISLPSGSDYYKFEEILREDGLLVLARPGSDFYIRTVTHSYLSFDDIKAAIEKFEKAFRAL